MRIADNHLGWEIQWFSDGSTHPIGWRSTSCGLYEDRNEVEKDCNELNEMYNSKYQFRVYEVVK